MSAARPLDLDVTVDDRRWLDLVPEPEPLLGHVIGAVLAAVPAPEASVEIGITLADDDRVRALNRDYRGQDRPTNVLSFALQDEAPGHDRAPAVAGAPLLLGDVVLGYETVIAEAAAQGKAPRDHLVHLVVHGVLHLLGYDHRSDAEALDMEGVETHVLAGLGLADPYAETEPEPHRGSQTLQAE